MPPLSSLVSTPAQPPNKAAVQLVASSYIDAEFAPQEYGVATKKGSDFSAVCEDLITGWLADGTIDGLIKENGLD